MQCYNGGDKLYYALCRELDNLAHIRQSVARLGGGARVELVHNAVSSSHEMVARAGGEQGNPGSNKVSTESGLCF